MLQAVIGGGAAGLVAARELIREGHSVTVFEQGNQIGGVWVLENTAEQPPLDMSEEMNQVHSSMYDSLRTNLPRELMSFSDFPFIPDCMLVCTSAMFCRFKIVS
jgi:aliphatic glucosinolate S-oxygenase